MNKLKKFLATLLSCAMLFSVVSVASVSAALPPDMEGDTHAEAVETLGALGIMVGDAETGLFRPDEPIKRSEFAKIAVTALGLADVAESSNYPTKYPDVVENHWANGYINVATNQKLVIGDDTGTFRPDDTITYAEAMTIIVRVIGHEPSALSKGGYPAGFLVVGAENNIGRNATAASNDPANRSLVAQMMFNALTVNMMEQTGFGDNPEYSVVEKTLLEDKLNTQKLKGQVVATSQTRLDGTGALKKGEVQIGEEIYKTGDVDATNLLGFNVVFYLQEDDYGDEYIILIRPEENKNTSLEISADNFESVEDQDDRKIIKYWKDKETDKKVTETEALVDSKLIYNNQYTTMDNELINLKDKAGKVTLLDSDRDGKYDLIFVSEYKNIVVDEIMPSSGKIIDKYDQAPITLDPNDEDLDAKIIKAGEEISINDLKEWDVLSVVENADKNIYRITVVSDYVEGMVEELHEDEVTINDTNYKIAKNYTRDINLEDEGRFYLDIEGKIAAVDATSRISSNYAYLINAAIAGSVNDYLELRMFTKDGETVIMPAADRIRLNGESGKTGEEVLAALSEDDEVVSQLITFEQNSDGKITSINTAADKTSTGEIDEDTFTKNLALSGAIYKSATGKVGNVNVGENTIIFDIPKDSTDPEDYAIRDKSLFENDTPYDVIVFDMQEDYTASAMIVTNTNYQASPESASAIVTAITTTKNDQNVIVDKLYAVQNGEQIELLATERNALVKNEDEPLQKGDIIQLKTNSKNEISKIRVLFDISKKTEQFIETPADDLEIIYGQVTAKFSTSMNIKAGEEAERNIAFGDAKIYYVDASKTNNIVQSAVSADIQKYDEADPSYVFVKSFEDVVQEIVIIKL